MPWVPIGYGYADKDAWFGGIMDGGGRTVSGMAAYASQNNRRNDGTYDLGFFGWAKNASVQNVLFANSRSVIDIPAATYFSCAVLAGRSNASSFTGCGVLSSCSLQMPAKGGQWNLNFVGGLVGDLHAGATSLTACFSQVSIQNNISVKASNVGVMVGRNIGTLKASGCYAAGSLQGAGYAFAAPGAVSLQNVYADTQLTGNAAGAGTALTTGQMKSLAALEGLNSGLKDASGTPYEAFVFDAANENGGYPLLVFGRAASGETIFTTRQNTLTVAPSLAVGEVLIPANVTGTGAASVKADSAFTAVFDLSSYMPEVAAGKDSPDQTAHPYPALQSAVLDLGAGGLPKGTAIVLAYRSGAKTGESYNRAYAKYTAASAIASGQLSLTEFTLPSSAHLTLAELLNVAKQQLVVYVDYSGVAPADGTPHTGEVSLVCAGAGDTQVLAGSHDLNTPEKMPGLSAGDPAAPGAYSLAFSSAPAGESGDLVLTVTYSGGSHSADNIKGVALGAAVCLKDETGKGLSFPTDKVTFSLDGATWAAPSNAYYMLVPASGQSFYVRGLTEAQAAQLTAQLYASSTQIDGTLPRGAYLVTETAPGGSSVAAGTYRLLFTLCDPQGTTVASAPFNFLLRAES
ncbi:hypothetical protein [Allofournierella sp.]|uniref:hypothetical protein n=1 Tax=Allofournierella sp. TaxID=1940256 RepID=UPI003AB12276